jgi:hypothetical protein
VVEVSVLLGFACNAFEGSSIAVVTWSILVALPDQDSVAIPSIEKSTST